MKNAKLNLIRLGNGDVITTSLSCSHVYGVAELYETYLWGFQNGVSSSRCIEKRYYGSLSNGIYHVDKDGNIIEVCPVWNGASSYVDYNYEEINKAHGGTGLAD